MGFQQALLALAAATPLASAQSAYQKAVFGDLPTSYYRLNEAAAGPFANFVSSDLSGSAQVGDGLPGSLSSVVPAATADGDSAIQFQDGAYVEVPFSPELNTPAFTVEAWVRIDGSIFQDQPVVSSFDYTDSTNYHGYYLRCFSVENDDGDNSPCTWEFGVATASGGDNSVTILAKVTSDMTPVVGEWIHVAGSAGSGELTLRVTQGSESDTRVQPLSVSVDDGSASVFTVSVNTVMPFLIGAGPAQPILRSYFHGAIDEVAVYAYELTAEQFEEHLTYASLALPQSPIGDSMSNPIEVTALPFTDSKNTFDFSDSFQNEGCDFKDPAFHASPDVVYVFQPTEDTFASISVCSSPVDAGTATFDTVIYVMREDAAGTVEMAQCNDDADTCSQFTSVLEDVFMTKDTKYYIIVDGYGQMETGTFTLDISEKPAPSQPGAFFIEQSRVVYSDALSEGWADWSFGATANFKYNDAVLTGFYAINTVVQDFGSFRLHTNEAFLATGVLQFWIAPLATTGSWDTIQVLVVGEDSQEPIQIELSSLVNIVEGEWAFVSVPLGDLVYEKQSIVSNIKGPGKFTDIMITNSGVGEATFLLDMVDILRASQFPGGSPAQLTAPPVEPEADLPLFVVGTLYDDSACSECSSSAVNGAQISMNHFAAHSGESAIRVEAPSFGGIELTTPTLSPVGLLSFWIKSVDDFDASNLDILIGNAVMPLSDFVQGVNSLEWSKVVIPLAGFEQEIEVIALQTTAEPGTFLLDDVIIATKAPTTVYVPAGTPIGAPTPAPLPADAPTPTPAPTFKEVYNVTQYLYDDELMGGWQDWSWSSERNLSYPYHVFSGEYSIRTDTSPWGVLSFGCGFGCEPISDSDVLSFHISSKTDLSFISLELWANQEDGSLVATGKIPIADLLVDPVLALLDDDEDSLPFTQVFLKLKPLGPYAWDRVIISDSTGEGVRFEVDEVKLMDFAGFIEIPNAPAPAPGPEDALGPVSGPVAGPVPGPDDNMLAPTEGPVSGPTEGPVPAPPPGDGPPTSPPDSEDMIVFTTVFDNGLQNGWEDWSFAVDSVVIDDSEPALAGRESMKAVIGSGLLYFGCNSFSGCTPIGPESTIKLNIAGDIETIFLYVSSANGATGFPLADYVTGTVEEFNVIEVPLSAANTRKLLQDGELEYDGIYFQDAQPQDGVDKLIAIDKMEVLVPVTTALSPPALQPPTVPAPPTPIGDGTMPPPATPGSILPPPTGTETPPGQMPPSGDMMPPPTDAAPGAPPSTPGMPPSQPPNGVTPPSTPPSDDSPPSDDGSSGTSTGAIVGIVVGALFGLILLAIIVAIVIKRKYPESRAALTVDRMSDAMGRAGHKVSKRTTSCFRPSTSSNAV
mmetsp:Transcript_6382/g.23626  ORF Transcript_6382/g.23626 Transcript_6382/m.23626 type:complete len:1365 (+) Transcript_6382:479-4573(+)